MFLIVFIAIYSLLLVALGYAWAMKNKDKPKLYECPYCGTVGSSKAFDGTCARCGRKVKIKDKDNYYGVGTMLF